MTLHYFYENNFVTPRLKFGVKFSKIYKEIKIEEAFSTKAKHFKHIIGVWVKGEILRIFGSKSRTSDQISSFLIRNLGLELALQLINFNFLSLRGLIVSYGFLNFGSF